MIVSLLALAWAGDRIRPMNEDSACPVASASLRDEVREIIMPRCGSCHTSTLATAKPGAIAVFDLAHHEWPATMSIHQLERFEGRLKSLDDSLKAKIGEFVKTETASRKSSGA